LFDPVEFARTRLKFELYEVQADILRSKATRGILLAAVRQDDSVAFLPGMAKAIHRAVTDPGT
jgi:hypothetical protein